MAVSVVSNASAIIALDRIGRLDLLREIYGIILVPPAVVGEVAPRLQLPSWVVERPLSQPVSMRILRGSLGPGESEAIALALEQDAPLLILDDGAARRLAQTIRLPVVGTLAILVYAKRRGFLSEIKPDLDRLLAQGFRASAALRKEILSMAGERAD